MRSGYLKHKIIIQEPTSTADGMGGSTITWSDLYPTRAAIWPLGARERLDMMKLEHHVDHRIRLRHPRMINITANMRIKWYDHVAETNKYFNIVAIINPDKHNMQLDLLVTEEV